MPLAQTEPANPRGKPLKRDALARHVEPAMEMRVRGKQRLHLAVGLVNIVGIAGECDPAKRSLALAKQRSDVRRDEARKIERARDAFVVRDLPNVVAVVECRNALCMKREHRVHMCGDRTLGRGDELAVTRGIPLRRLPLLDAPAGRQVAVNQIVRGRLIGHHVGTNVLFDQLWKDFGGVAQ